MESLFGLWRSLTNSVSKPLNSLESLLKILNQTKFGRFILGIIIGVFPVIIYWGYAVFFKVNIPLNQGIIGSLVIMVAFGIIGAYGKLEKLLDGMSDIQL